MITNVRRGGGAGGGGTGGFEFPAETIVLSGEDLTAKGYKPLDQNLALTKTEAPKLYEIYKGFLGDFYFGGRNDHSYLTFQFGEHLFAYLNNNTLFISSDFGFNNDIINIDLSSYTEANKYVWLLGQNEGELYFRKSKSNENMDSIIFFEYNHTATKASDLVDNITITNVNFSPDLQTKADYRDYYAARDHFIFKMSRADGDYTGQPFAAGEMRAYDIQELKAKGDVSQMTPFLIGPNASPSVAAWCKNGGYFTNSGAFYDYLTQQSVQVFNGTVTSSNYRSYFTHYYDYKTKRDIVSMRDDNSSNASYFLGAASVDETGFASILPTQKYNTLFNEITGAAVSSSRDLQTLIYMTENKILGGQSSVTAIINGVGTFIKTYQAPFYSQIDSTTGVSFPAYTSSDQNTTYSLAYNDYRYQDAIITRDYNNDRNSFLIKFIETESEAFVINAIPYTDGTDKKYWIKVE